MANRMEDLAAEIAKLNAKVDAVEPRNISTVASQQVVGEDGVRRPYIVHLEIVQAEKARAREAGESLPPKVADPPPRRSGPKVKDASE